MQCSTTRAQCRRVCLPAAPGGLLLLLLLDGVCCACCCAHSQRPTLLQQLTAQRHTTIWDIDTHTMFGIQFSRGSTSINQLLTLRVMYWAWANERDEHACRHLTLPQPLGVVQFVASRDGQQTVQQPQRLRQSEVSAGVFVTLI